MLALGEFAGPSGNLWRVDVKALIGIHEVVAVIVQERIDHAVSAAAHEASEGLTKRFQRPAVAPPLPDVEDQGPQNPRGHWHYQTGAEGPQPIHV